MPPGIDATFLNNVENFLDQITSSAVADSHITADGNGNMTVNGSIQIVSSTNGLRINGQLVLSSPLSQDVFLNAPNVGSGHKCVLQVGGVRVLSVDQSGNTTIRGSLTQNGTP